MYMALRCAKWLRSVPPKQVTMAVHTVTLEAHEIASRANLWCPACHTNSMTSVTVAIADADSLQVITRATGTDCQHCGASAIYR